MRLYRLLKEFFHAWRRLTPLASSLLAIGAQPTHAQPPGDSLTRVFVECDACDDAYLRERLTFVNLVRDRLLADVHVLVTSLETGSAGRRYTFEMSRRQGDRLVADTLRASIAADASDVERREQLGRVLRLGLVRFLYESAVLPYLDVTFSPPAPGGGPTRSATRGARDRWNQWVFRLNANGAIDGDDNYGSRSGGGGLRASRITEAIKLDVAVDGESSRSRYTLSDGERIVSRQRRWSSRGLVARSIGKHFAAGIAASASSSSFENTRLLMRALPALEYDVFPYSEATQRQIVLRYGVGLRSMRYEDTTIYGRLRETRPVHELDIASDVRQRWGSVFGSAEWSQYLHDTSKRRFGIQAGVDWRIIAGLSMNVGGAYSVIRDQLNIPGTKLSDEDRLLRLRELRSGYSFSGGMGFSYTFGSVFNNVVNPRFRL